MCTRSGLVSAVANALDMPEHTVDVAVRFLSLSRYWVRGGVGRSSGGVLQQHAARLVTALCANEILTHSGDSVATYGALPLDFRLARSSSSACPVHLVLQSLPKTHSFDRFFTELLTSLSSPARRPAFEVAFL